MFFCPVKSAFQILPIVTGDRVRCMASFISNFPQGPCNASHCPGQSSTKSIQGARPFCFPKLVRRERRNSRGGPVLIVKQGFLNKLLKVNMHKHNHLLKGNRGRQQRFFLWQICVCYLNRNAVTVHIVTK